MKAISTNVVSFYSLFLYIVQCRAVWAMEPCEMCSCNVKAGLVKCRNLNKFPEVSKLPVNTTSMYVMYSNLKDGVPTDQLHKLNKLKYLYIQNNKINNLNVFGPSNLIVLHLDHNDIQAIEPGSFDKLQQLSELSLTHNKLTEFPSFQKPLKISDLSLRGNNKIKTLSRRSLQNLPSLENLYLEETGITEIPNTIFHKNTKLLKIDLEGTTSLTSIKEDAFEGASYLETLILDDTRITSLPQHGLENLRNLSLKNVPNFWKLPPGLWSMQEVHLSPYNGFLCCAFDLGTYNQDCTTQNPNRYHQNTSSPSTPQSETGQYTKSASSVPTSTAFPTTKGKWTWPGFGGTTQLPTTSNSSSNSRSRAFTFPGGDGGFVPSPTKTNSSSSGGEGFGTHPPNLSTPKVKTFTFPIITNVHNTTVIPSSKVPHGNYSNNNSVFQCPKDRVVVKCFPKPDAFHPCEDVMGYTLLTVVSFIVGALALLANLVVALVLVTSQKRFNVTRFLMCNLAFADFLLGLYIFILTCFSIETHGKYFNYVRQWQHGAGCKILGFLAVFSSELSLFTLVVMTVERFYAIVYAMHRNARLSYRKAVRAMVVGWVFSLLMATLPLTEVNSYRKVAICLPFDVADTGSIVYVALLLVLNGIAFVLVAYLYARMLKVVVQGGDMEGAPKRNDSKVAKRMALLVFTDMACWAPIAFFGLLAAFGAPLLNVTESKVLLVFFFPINSVCNPFLYSFFTKAFKREFFALLSRFGFCKFRALKYNGTLSSFMYSRSRRNQSTNDDRAKRVSTLSSPSYDFRQSNIELFDSKPTNKTVENIQMDGISNLAFNTEASQTSSSTSPRLSIATEPIENDEVLVPSSPNKPPSNTNSPKSILKKTSTVENDIVKTKSDLQEQELKNNDNSNEAKKDHAL